MLMDTRGVDAASLHNHVLEKTGLFDRTFRLAL